VQYLEILTSMRLLKWLTFIQRKDFRKKLVNFDIKISKKWEVEVPDIISKGM